MPTLTLLAASVAATLSVVDIATDEVSNRPVPVVVPPLDEEPAAGQDNPQPTVTIATRRPLPQYNPYIPPIVRAGTSVDECLNPPVGRGPLVPC